MASGTATSHVNKPYANMYSASDPRFYFPSTPGDGSIMYYSSVYNKWTGSDVSRFVWDATSNILALNGTFNIQDIYGSYQVKVKSGTFFIENGTSSLYFASTGQTALQGSDASLILFAQSASPTVNYYKLFTSGSQMKINYSGTNIADIFNNGTT